MFIDKYEGNNSYCFVHNGFVLIGACYLNLELPSQRLIELIHDEDIKVSSEDPVLKACIALMRLWEW